MIVFWQFLNYELKNNVRQAIEYCQSLLFFILVIVLFPLSISVDPNVLANMASGILWIAALLATLLGLPALFRNDFETGVIEKVLLSPRTLLQFIFAKILAHWCLTGFPLVIISPLLGTILGLTVQANSVLLISLLLGTPALSFIGAIIVALTLQVKNNAMLLPLLIIPLFIPILIFGTSAVLAAHQELSSVGALKILGALLILSIIFTPFATASALRVGEYQ